MKNCPFCNFNKKLLYNKIIEETDNFYIVPSLGSLVEGYILIVPKEHICCTSNISVDIIDEYNIIIEKYRNLFKEIYGRYPIVFEHGTLNTSERSASSVVHGHTHIVNHNYKNEKEILDKLNMNKINSILDIDKNNNYIYYKSPNGTNYITYDFEPISQIMRLFIAKDLGIKDKYNWKLYRFDDNIKKTINKLKDKV